MNELQQYVASLQEQGLGKEEIKAKVKEWKQANQPLKKEEDKKPSYFKEDGSGDLNPDAFNSEDSKKRAIKVNEDAKKEKDSADAIPVVESDKKDTESLSENTLSDSYFTTRDGDIIFNLEAFSEETRGIAAATNMPELDKEYNIGSGSYKMQLNANGEPIFYSKPLNAKEFSSAEDDPLRSAVIAQKLGIGNPDFNVDDFDIENPIPPDPPDLPAEDLHGIKGDGGTYVIENDELVNISKLDEVVITPGILEDTTLVKVNNKVVSARKIRKAIENKDTGFKKINSFEDYLKAHRKAGNKIEIIDNYEGSVAEKYDDYLNSTDISYEKELEIERFTNSISFEPIEKEIVTGGGGSSLTGITPSTTITQTIEPYKEELSRAREILQYNRQQSGSKEPITQKEVEAFARTIIRNDKITAEHDKLKTEYLDNLPEEQRLQIAQYVYNRIEDNSVLYGGKLPRRYFDPETGDILGRKELKERFDFETRFKKLENSGTARTIEALTNAINKDKAQLVDLYEQIKEGQANGFNVTNLAEQYNNTITLLNKRITAANENKEELRLQYQGVALDYQKYISKSTDYNTDIYELDWLKRNYSYIEKHFTGDGATPFATSTLKTVLGIGTQLLSLLDTFASGWQPMYMDYSDEAMVDRYNKPNVLTTELLEAQSLVIEYEKRRAERYKKGVQFENAFDSIGNMGEYLFDRGIELVPYYATMIGGSVVTGNPYVGMMLASMSSGGMYQGERYNEMQNGGRPYDHIDMSLAGFGFSTLEYAGGILPTWKIFKSLRSRWGGTVGGEKLEAGLDSWWRRRVAGAPEFVRLVGMDVAGEVAVTQVGQNIIDGRPWLQGTGEAGFMSLIFAKTMYSAPLITGAIFNSLATPKMTQEFKDNLAKWNMLERSLYDYRFKPDKTGVRPYKASLTPEQILKIKAQQLELKQANDAILIDQNKKLENIDPDGFAIYSAAMERLATLQAQADTINNNSELTRAEKETLLEPLRAEFESLVAGRDQYVAAFTRTFNLLPKKQQEKLKADALSSLRIKGIENPSGKQIQDEAEKIHTTQRFELNIEKGLALFQSLKGKGIDISYELGVDNKKVLSKYKKMLDKRVADDKNSLTKEQADQEYAEFKEAIEDGTMNGTTLVTQVTNAKGETKLVYDVIVSQQNSIANRASETVFHEFNHVLFSEALGVDPKAFTNVANSILSYLAQNEPTAFTRIMAKADRSRPDEVIIQFLEELSARKINIQKASDKTFWNVLAYGVNKAVKGVGDKPDFNMDFSGPNGALQFFQTLADAWNNKELSVDALNKIVDSDVWQGEAFTQDEVVITAPGKKRSQVISPQGINFIDLYNQGIYTNEDFVNILKSRDPKERYAAAEALVENNFGVIKGVLGYERRGIKGIDENGIKQAIIELMLGGDIASWSGKTTPLFEEGSGFDPSKGKVTTYLTRLGNRADIIFEQGKLYSDTVFDTAELGDVDAGVVETEVETTTTPVKEIDIDTFKVLKKSNKEAIVANVLDKIKAGEIDLESGITLKDLKPFSEAAAQQIADELGIPVSRILDYKDNLRKGEVTPIQMFIKNNASTLLAMLKQIKGNADIQVVQTKRGPVKIGGEGRRLAQKLLDAFYIQLKGEDGKPVKVKNQIQYRLDPSKLNMPYFLSVFGMDAKGNIKDGRSGTAQASKGLMELLARLQTLNAIEIAIDQQVAAGEKTPAEGARQKAQVKRKQKQDVTRDWKKGKYPVELPLLVKVPSTTLNSKGVPKKEFDLTTAEGRKFVNTIDDFIKLNPTLGEYLQRGMTGGFSLTFNTKPKFQAAMSTEIQKSAIGRIKYSNKGGILNPKAIERFIDDPGLIKKKFDEIEKLFLAIQDYIKKNPDSAPDFARFIADSASDQNHPIRYLAPVIGYAINPITGKIDVTKIAEEHMMPANQIAKQLLDAAIKGQVKSEMKIVRASYSQIALRFGPDQALKALGLNESMPKSFYDLVIPLIEQGKLDFLPDGLASWIRYSTNNTANPFAYKLIKPKMTVGEFFVGKLNIKSEAGIAMAGEFANGLITKVLTGEITLAEAKAEFKIFKTKVLPLKIKAAENIDGTFGKKVARSQTVADKIKILDDYDKARRVAQDPNAPVKGISVLDFDDTVGITNSKIVVTMPNGGIRILNATEFALEHSNLEALGAEFDFSDFNKVVDGKRGPLFDKLKKAVDKYGNSNVFILTARAPEAATAIFEWLKSEGVTLKFNNIVGLADGSAQAKANWMVSKVAEGYNDFYFSDDAILNTQAVSDVYNALDIKGTVVQAMRSKQKNFTTIMNDIIENKTGIEAYKNYSAAKAQTLGAGKGKYNFYIPPSAEDFTGLLYRMLGKGKIGDAQMAFFKDNLLDPYNRAEIEIDEAKISASRDYNALKAAFPKLPKSLKKETGIGKFTFEHAIRAYIWEQQGMTIPGLSKRDLKRLTDFVKADLDLKVFSDELIKMQKGKEYPKPNAGWVAGTITTDIINGINKVNRKLYLQEWQENVDIIFSDAIINKLEAAFGSGYVKALRSSLDAMKRGSNRSSNTDSITEKWYDWINNSVGVVMFLNTRSALLQMISNVNFINWSDNNPLKAAKAFTNQPQYWKDVMFLLNSPYLKSRRDGLKINISESEIADLAASKENKIQGFIALALNKGFVFTRYADSFAIASGGATFYRNRYNALIKQGIDPATAEKQAFEDFREISETSQQSSNAAKISDQQRSAAGRLILSFGNTQMQYARIQKRAIQDLINRRGSDKENLSKLIYYSTVQNLMFNALQQGVQFLLFDGDESDEKDQAKRSQRISRTLNGMFDSQVRGIGIQGALVVTLKNTLMTIAEEMGKNSSDYSKAVDDLFSIAPPIQAKLRKLNSSANTFSWNKKDIERQGIHLNNPAYLAIAQTMSALTNIPVDEAVIKINALRNILSDQTKAWQKIALGLGWSTWDVGLPYYGVGEGKELSAEEKAVEEINVMKKETSAADQKQMLLDLGLTKKEIKALKYEEDRVKKIIALQKKKKNEK